VVAVRAGAGAGAGGWSVQLGLFSKRENAQRLARTAQQKGFPVSVSGADGKGLYRVRTSAGERARAVALLQEMKAQGLPGALTSSQ
jgi:cell division septation protein DedD